MMASSVIDRRALLAAGAAFGVSIAIGQASRANAADPLRVAKSLRGILAYTPLDIGSDHGIFQKAGVAVEEITFNGSSKMHQGMVGGALDIGLGSGSTMIDILKGEPSLCVAQTLGPPTELGILVPYDSPIRSIDDLKGKTIGVATVGSPTEWLAFELARVKGWGPHGVRTVETGGGPNGVAALRAHIADAVVGNVSQAFMLEPQKQIRLLIPCSQYAKNFIMHAIFASTSIMQARPDAVRAFLRGWFDTVAFMRANKAATVAAAAKIDGIDPAAQEREYDLVAPQLSTTGRFEPQDVAAIARSYVDLQLLDKVPDMSKLYTEQFLPAPGRTAR
jgi:NitT/TauT family transport system substrate-binding protein